MERVLQIASGDELEPKIFVLDSTPVIFYMSCARAIS